MEFEYLLRRPLYLKSISLRTSDWPVSNFPGEFPILISQLNPLRALGK
jgi:hypothetical protein